jgi:murein DD-endopeptidase MepM/ murein hydrolase activator NlpD
LRTSLFDKSRPCAVTLAHAHDRACWSRFIGMALLVTAIGGVGATQTWASVDLGSSLRPRRPAISPAATALKTLTDPAPVVLAAAPFAGADIDGDGKSDFVNPTGGAERVHDDYGSGAFGSSRDGGERRHEGVDYVSRPGQVVVSPLSGYVARVGFAYSDDSTLRTIEIVNPALKYVAKVLYVSPTVEVGQAVAVGAPVGVAQSLAVRYPGNMTNHVHLQIARQGGPWINAERLIPTARG